MNNDSVHTVIESVLESMRPAIQRDGGDITFVRMENNRVYVQLKGACINCPASSFTLKLGIEQALKKAIPTILEVIAL